MVNNISITDLSRKLILCRADGNSNIGLGHLYRMIAIAEYYKDDYEVIFITRSSSAISVVSSKFKLRLIPEEISITNEPKWLSNNFAPSDCILVYDGYQFISTYQKSIKKYGFKSIYIDDLTIEYMYADIVVNPALISEASIYIGERYTEFVFGTKYSMLRPKFYEMAGKKRSINSLKDIFIFFGGSDPHNLTLRACKACLLLEGQLENVHIILGNPNTYVELLELTRGNSKFKVYKNLNESELIEVMLKCDLAVVPSSTILYELCCVEMIILAGYFVQNQKLIYDNLVVNDAIIGCGDFSDFSVSDFESKMLQVLKLSESDCENMLTNQSRLFDGKSKYRFLSLIDRLNMSFRKVNEGDLTLLYNWSNDKVVRENSYNKSEISFVDHSQWFLRKLSDSNSLVLIAMINGQESGTVRYELDDDSTTVGISIAQEFRGRNLGGTMLRQSAIKYVETLVFPVLASIKVKNDASVKAFKSGGYKFYQNEVVKGVNSYVYKLEKEDVYK